jgi:arginine deiminase
MVKNEGDPLKKVVVCTPREEYARAGNRKEHNIGDLGDPAAAIRQHDTLVKDLLRKNGYIVHDLDLSEFAKGMGGPNCLIMPIERRA